MRSEEDHGWTLLLGVKGLTGFMRKVRKVPPGEPDDFEMASNDSLIAQFRDLTLAVRAGVATDLGVLDDEMAAVERRLLDRGLRDTPVSALLAIAIFVFWPLWYLVRG